MRGVGETGHHILRDQLAVTGDEFWACAQHGTRPNRIPDVAPAITKPLPLSLARALLASGVPAAELEGLDADAARELLRRQR